MADAEAVDGNRADGATTMAKARPTGRSASTSVDRGTGTFAIRVFSEHGSTGLLLKVSGAGRVHDSLTAAPCDQFGLTGRRIDTDRATAIPIADNPRYGIGNQRATLKSGKPASNGGSFRPLVICTLHSNYSRPLRGQNPYGKRIVLR